MTRKRKGISVLNNIVHIRFSDHEYRLLKSWSFAEDEPMSSIVRSITLERLKGMEKVLTAAVISVTIKHDSENIEEAVRE